MPGDILSTRALNRALLGRQLLLERTELPIADALEHLVGLQAQVPTDPYFALWSRLRNFDAGELGGMVERGEAVRAPVMRGTIHLATARDAVVLRPAMESVMRKTFASSAHAKSLEGADVEAIASEALRLIRDEGPLSRADLARLLGERWPDLDAQEMAHAAHFLLPLAQVPPRGVWGKTMQAKWAPLEDLAGMQLDEEGKVAEAVVRYLRAFGPAAPKDVRAWSYLTGLREVIHGLRPQLRVFKTEEGTELLDVGDGLFPDPETPAPVRFLPEYDNATLGFADRSRVLPPPEGERPYWRGTVLVDGFASGTWRFDRHSESVAIEVMAWRKLTPKEREEVHAEGEALLAWAEPEAGRRAVRLG